MNNTFKKFISAATLLCSVVTLADPDNCSTCSTCPNTCGRGQNLYQPHAFSVSMSREILNDKHAFFPTDNEEGWFGQVSVSGEYQRSFKEKCGEISSCCDTIGSLPFWGANNTNQMSAGDNSGNFDLDLYQIGMGPVVVTDGGDTLTINPFVYQAGADFFLYVGAHKTERGFFLKAHGPVGLISIDPRLQFSSNLEAVDYPAGAINANDDGAVVAPNTTIGEGFMSPKGAGFLKKMEYGLISQKRTSSAKFGDLEFTLGYNVFADEKKNFGLGIRFSAPTGNKAQAQYMLEPIFGRNGHWGAGGELIGTWRCWEADKSNAYMSIMFDGTIMHLFNSKHMRSFDLKNNGAGSKYLLLSKFSGTVPQNQVVNAVNITTLSVESSFAFEGNFAFAFDFHWNNWSMALGYEGWGRYCEKLRIDCSCPGSVDFNDYAVLGRQYAAQVNTNPLLCEPAATIGTSQAYATVATSTIVNATDSKNRISSDINEALDIEGQIARAIYTSKPFVQLQYTWTDCEYNPYLGVYGGAEIPHGKVKNSAVKFWNIGAQGGIAF